MFTLEGVHGEQYGLLKSIFDNPDDDTVRLVYADWLDGRDGPGDAEHAEFIRVQVALAAGRDDGELFTRQRELALTLLDWELPGIDLNASRVVVERDLFQCCVKRTKLRTYGDPNREGESVYAEDVLRLVFRRGFPEINKLIVGSIYPGRMVYLRERKPRRYHDLSWAVDFGLEKQPSQHLIQSFPDHNGVVIITSTPDFEIEVEGDPIETIYRTGYLPTFLSSFGRVLIPSGQPSPP
jgi:uncharacterized protein (TIGR02996 family)